MKIVFQLAIATYLTGLTALAAGAPAAAVQTNPPAWAPKAGDVSEYSLTPVPAPPGFPGAKITQKIESVDATQYHYSVKISVSGETVNEQQLAASISDFNGFAVYIDSQVRDCLAAGHPSRHVAAGDFVNCKLNDGKPTETYIANVPFAIIYFDSKGTQGSAVEKVKTDIMKWSADARDGSLTTPLTGVNKFIQFPIDFSFAQLAEKHDKRLGLDFAQTGDQPSAQTVLIQLLSYVLGK